MCKRKQKRKSSKDYEKKFNEGYGKLNIGDFAVHVTNHFVERTKERCRLEISVDELMKNKLEHLSGEYYEINGMIVVLSVKDNDLTLITNLGFSEEQPNIINMLVYDGAFKFMKLRKKYGNLKIA